MINWSDFPSRLLPPPPCFNTPFFYPYFSHLPASYFYRISLIFSLFFSPYFPHFCLFMIFSYFLSVLFRSFFMILANFSHYSLIIMPPHAYICDISSKIWKVFLFPISWFWPISNILPKIWRVFVCRIGSPSFSTLRFVSINMIHIHIHHHHHHQH